MRAAPGRASARAIPSAARASAPTTRRSPTGSSPSRGATARIGATGISYLGAACDFLASTGHKAVKAIAPLFAVWDTWADNYYPGGMLIKRLALVYDELMLALDHDRRDLRSKFSYFADPALQGPMPVDDDKDGSLAREAVKGHLANFRMPDFMSEFKFRDDTLPYDPSFSSASFGPYNYLDQIPKDVAVYAISGWMDGAGYANGTLSRFLTLPNAQRRIMLGPWDHGARVNVSPWRGRIEPELPVLGEVLRFFDQHLAGRETGLLDEAPIHYFAMHAEEWRAAESWPPVKSSRQFFTAPDHRLAKSPSDAATAASYQADFSVGSGAQTRYERIAGIDATAYYADWTERERGLLSFTTEPLPAALEIAGHPVVSLWLASSEPDAAVFVYLSEVEADGTVALRHRRAAARHPSRRGAGAQELPHDLAVAHLRAQGRQADAGRRAAAPALRPAADGLALRRRQPHQALDRGRRRRPFRADAARPAAVADRHERRREGDPPRTANRRMTTMREAGDAQPVMVRCRRIDRAGRLRRRAALCDAAPDRCRRAHDPGRGAGQCGADARQGQAATRSTMRRRARWTAATMPPRP